MKLIIFLKAGAENQPWYGTIGGFLGGEEWQNNDAHQHNDQLGVGHADKRLATHDPDQIYLKDNDRSVTFT